VTKLVMTTRALTPSTVVPADFYLARVAPGNSSIVGLVCVTVATSVVALGAALAAVTDPGRLRGQGRCDRRARRGHSPGVVGIMMAKSGDQLKRRFLLGRPTRKAAS
jgi:hypothetical protein